MGMVPPSEVPAELEAADWALPPTLAKDNEALMQEVLAWLPDMLVKLELGDEPEDGEDAGENDSEFVDMARPWLHTKAYGVVKSPSQPEIAQELWAEMAAADFLQQEGGSSLLLLPAASNDMNTFNEIVAAVRVAAREHINKALVVSGLHPQSQTASSQSPVPTIMLFFDDPNLLVKGGSLGDVSGFL